MIRVLLIDDESSIRKAIRRVLEINGYSVDDVSDGNQGIEMYRANPYEIVITDIIMAKKGGYEIIRELRREFPEVNIIAVSGGGELGKNQILKTADRLGAKAYLGKPFSADELLSTVNQFIDPDKYEIV